MDDRVGLKAIDRAEQGVAVDGVDDHRPGAERAQHVVVDRRPTQPDDSVTSGDQMAGQGDAYGS